MDSFKKVITFELSVVKETEPPFITTYDSQVEFKPKRGDLVVKAFGDYDRGSIGLILGTSNLPPHPNLVLKILKNDGTIRVWSSTTILPVRCI